MQQKPVCPPLVCCAAVILVLVVLSNVGHGWAEYRNFDRTRSYSFDTDRTGYTFLALYGPARNSSFNLPGLQVYRWAVGRDGSLDVQVAHWLLMTPIAVASLAIALRIAFNRTRTNRRLRDGHCPQCGYDLSATPNRCPECGEFAVASSA